MSNTDGILRTIKGLQEGQIVFWDDDPIGVAARDIPPGSFLKYDPIKNTEDILTERTLFSQGRDLNANT